jgi:MFS family permease
VKRRSLPTVVKQLGVVSFFNDLASEMVYPLLPAFITTRLGAGALALGALDGIADGVASVMKLLSGRLADTVRWRRPLVVIGYVVAAVARPLTAFSSAAGQVIALRAADRTGKGARTPPRDAVIADASLHEIRGRAFGYHRSMDHAGAVAGPLVAWIMLSTAAKSPSDVIAWSAVPGFLAVIAVVWATRDIGHSEPGSYGSDASAPHVSDGNATPAASSPPLLALIMFFALARFPETLFLLRLQDLGLAVSLIPALWALLHVVRTFGSYPGGWLSDHVGPKITMLLGWTVYALVCLGLALASTQLTASLYFIGFGVVTSLTESPERAFVAGYTAQGRGTRYGIYHAGVGVAALVGGVAFGTIYARLGAATALTVSAALAVLLVLIGALSRR